MSYELINYSAMHRKTMDYQLTSQGPKAKDQRPSIPTNLRFAPTFHFSLLAFHLATPPLAP